MRIVEYGDAILEAEHDGTWTYKRNNQPEDNDGESDDKTAAAGDYIYIWTSVACLENNLGEMLALPFEQRTLEMDATYKVKN